MRLIKEVNACFKIEGSEHQPFFQSENAGRIAQNLDLFSFSLDQEDLDELAKLDKHQRFNDAGTFCQAAFNTFCPIYE